MSVPQVPVRLVDERWYTTGLLIDQTERHHAIQ
jgi:hypothetical protein